MRRGGPCAIFSRCAGSKRERERDAEEGKGEERKRAQSCVCIRVREKERQGRVIVSSSIKFSVCIIYPGED